MLGKRCDHIKGEFRDPGTKWVPIDEDVAHLSEYYVAGQEVAVFSSTSAADQSDKVLPCKRQRERIREAGCQRTLRNQTYVKSVQSRVLHFGATSQDRPSQR